MWSSRQRPDAIWILLIATSLAALAAGPVPAAEETGSTPARTTSPSVTLTVQETGESPAAGRVILEVAQPEPEDPPDAVRLQAVLVGPLEGPGSDDLFAFTAGLLFPSDRLEYLPATLHKGNLLERDGRSSWITGGVARDEPSRVTIGASRLGAVPGIAVPSGRAILFSAAFRILAAGEATLSWEDASFIDSSIKPVEGARFIAATLRVTWPEE